MNATQIKMVSIVGTYQHEKSENLEKYAEKEGQVQNSIIKQLQKSGSFGWYVPHEGERRGLTHGHEILRKKYHFFCLFSIKKHLKRLKI